MLTTHIRLLHQEFADASLQESALSGWTQRYNQINSGTYSGSVDTLALPGVSIVRERVNLATAQQIVSPFGTVVFVSSLSSTADWRVNATRRGAHIVSVYRGGTEVTAVAPDHSDVLIVTLEASRLGLDPEAIPSVRHVPGTSQTEATKQWLASLLAIYEGGHAPPELSGVLPGLVIDRMRAVCEYAQRGGTGPATSSRAVYDVYRRALRAVEDLDREPVSVVELAFELGVTPVGLREAFIATIGVTPGTWLRQHRLDGARRDLARCGDSTISEIAMKWGFWHLGRFSAYYAQRYGQSPSDDRQARAASSSTRSRPSAKPHLCVPPHCSSR